MEHLKNVRIIYQVHIVLWLCVMCVVAADNECHTPIIRIDTTTGLSGTCSKFVARTDWEKPDIDDVTIAEREIASYRGLRYAEPPIGARRFAPPRLREFGHQTVDDQDGSQHRPGDYVDDKNIDLLIDGTRARPGCPQGHHPMYKAEAGTSEDCLFLDVFVPLPLPEAAPVMVWLHGGGFMFGAGTVDLLSPLPLVALGDVIVVTLNHRLGALGFLTTGDEEIVPNLGLLDQITALRWIQKYIPAFGGDPERVTLFGDSAGSTSIHLHLMSPRSTGLFHRAILQSGTVTSSWAQGPSMEGARRRAHALGRLLGCSEVSDIDGDDDDDDLSSAQLKKCLMDIPSQKFVENQQQVLQETQETSDIAFVPIVDNDVLPNLPDVVGESRSYNNVSVIIGANADEGMMMLMWLFPNATTTPTVNRSQFREYLSSLVNIRDPVLQKLVEFVYDYDDDYADQSKPCELHPYLPENDLYDQLIRENDKDGDRDSDDDNDDDDDDDDDDEDDDDDDDDYDVGDGESSKNKYNAGEKNYDPDDEEEGNDEINQHCNRLETPCAPASFFEDENDDDNEEDYFDDLNDIVGDKTMFCPTEAVANYAARAGLVIFRYHMTYRPTQSLWRPVTWTKVNHGENLVFVFGFHFLPHLDWKLTPEEVAMTTKVIRYWTNFAATGDPNRCGTRDCQQRWTDELKPWPRYNTKTAISKNLSPSMADDTFYRAWRCRFWNKIFPRLQEQLEAERD